MKSFKTYTCANCGGPDAIHQFETMLCPAYGREAPYPQKQRWDSTVFEDSGEKALQNAAPKLFEAVELFQKEWPNFLSKTNIAKSAYSAREIQFMNNIDLIMNQAYYQAKPKQQSNEQ